MSCEKMDRMSFDYVSQPRFVWWSDVDRFGICVSQSIVKLVATF